jgi:ribosomal protein S18 acetylase RimI-like enzyme
VDDLRFRDVALPEIGLIKPLWEKLNRLHRDDSPFFKDRYDSLTFEQRIGLIRNMPPDRVLVTVVEAAGAPVGYCVSAVHHHGCGEIESLYLEPDRRGQGAGRKLVDRHLAWLNSHGCPKIRVAVAYGHDSVFDFYKKLGFYPRLTYLEYKG